ncbi:DUF4388 domain-containing protein [Verrucomicrobiota bacterium]
MPDLLYITVIEGAIILIAGAVIFYFAALWKEAKKAAERARATSRMLEQERDQADAAKNNLSREKNLGLTLFRNTNEMVFVHGVTEDGLPGNFLDVNDTFCDRIQRTRKELLEMTPLDIEVMETPLMAKSHARSELAALSDDYINKSQQKIASRSARQLIESIQGRGSLVYDKVYEARDGKHIPVSVTSRPFDVADSRMIMCTAVDVTEQQETKQALQESRRQFHDVLASSPFGIAIYDGQKGLLRTNRACLKMFGSPDQEQFARFNPFDNPFLAADIREKLGRGESLRYEAAIDFDEAIAQALFVSTRKEQGYFDVIMSNMGYDEEQRSRGYLMQLQDITERRRVEADLRKLQAMPAEGDAKAGITGSLADIGFTDLVQLLCATDKKLQLSLTTDGQKGSLFIDQGNIMHCAVGDKEGQAAFYELMRWRAGQFTTEPCEQSPARTVQASLMSLLLEGTRLVDEG